MFASELTYFSDRSLIQHIHHKDKSTHDSIYGANGDMLVLDSPGLIDPGHKFDQRLLIYVCHFAQVRRVK
jgi:hypothetical protein